MKSLISFVVVFFISLLFSFSDCFANEIGSELNNNLSEDAKLNKLKSDINDKVDTSKSTNDDIFGDEQAFPFIAGLGKNAAH